MGLVILSLVIFLILFWGRSLGRVNRKKHVRITGFAMIVDVILVLYLALGKEVLSKINSKMSALLMLHIFLALAVVVAYGFATHYGLQLWKGKEEYRAKMIVIDKIIVPTRFMVFVTILIIKLTA